MKGLCFQLKVRATSTGGRPSAVAEVRSFASILAEGELYRFVCVHRRIRLLLPGLCHRSRSEPRNSGPGRPDTLSSAPIVFIRLPTALDKHSRHAGLDSRLISVCAQKAVPPAALLCLNPMKAVETSRSRPKLGAESAQQVDPGAENVKSKNRAHGPLADARRHAGRSGLRWSFSSDKSRIW